MATQAWPRQQVRARWRVCLASDTGSMIPMIILAFSIAGLVITGSISAGSAFLAQRDLQSACDGAAIAGAQALGNQRYYHSSHLSDLPLGNVQAAVDQYVAENAAVDRNVVRAAASVGQDGTTVTVRCAEHVDIPFQTVFSPGGLDRDATASARSPTNG